MGSKATRLKVLTEPTSKLMMTTAEAASRLGVDDSAAVLRFVERASAAIAAEFDRPIAYGQYREEFFGGDRGRTIALTARPVASIVEVLDPSEDPPAPLVEDEDFSIFDEDPGAPTRLRAASRWPATSASPLVPDWRVDYWAGWWLPAMVGAKPAGAASLPLDIVEACWIMVRAISAADARDPGVRSDSVADRKIEFFEGAGDDLGAKAPAVATLLRRHRGLVL